MIELEQLQGQAPHKNHSSIVRSVFEELEYGRGIKAVYPAYGHAIPPLGATATQSPRIVICLTGENIMHIPQGGEALEISLKPYEATFICGGAWNYPTHIRNHCFMTLDFSFDHVRYFIKEKEGVRRLREPQSYFRRDGSLDRFTSYTLHAVESLIAEHSGNRLDALRDLTCGLIRQAYDGLSVNMGIERVTPAAKWEIVKDFIDVHLHDPLTREDVSAAIDVHPNHLSRLVKRFSGQSYISFLKERRLVRATELLKTYDIPVYEVGKRCGFPTPTNFSNAFRHKYDCSPGAYRSKSG